MTYQVGQLFKVANNYDLYHVLKVGSIVRFVGPGYSSPTHSTLCFELVEGVVDRDILDDDHLEDFDEFEHLHDCDGIVPSGRGQYLKPHHIKPLPNEDEDDLYV